MHTLISAHTQIFAGRGDVAKAKEYLGLLREAGFKPDAYSYTPLFNALFSQQQQSTTTGDTIADRDRITADVMQLFDEVVTDSDVQLDTYLFNMLLKGFGEKGEHTRVAEIAWRMGYLHGVKPDLFTFRLVKQFVKEGTEEEQEVKKKLLESMLMVKKRRVFPKDPKIKGHEGKTSSGGGDNDANTEEAAEKSRSQADTPSSHSTSPPSPTNSSFSKPKYNTKSKYSNYKKKGWKTGHDRMKNNQESEK